MNDIRLNEKEAKVKNTKKSSVNSTQHHLRIDQITADTVVLKNGGTRAVLETNSINFHLKSEAEQNGIIQAYQSFLNVLDFPIQIVVRSKRLDLDHYLDNLTKLADNQANVLLQRQTYDYINYIKRLLEYADIMSKSFYVVVPYNGVQGDEKPSGFIPFFQKFLQRLFKKTTDSKFLQQKRQFATLKKGLDHRVNIVMSGLANCGLQVKQLNTEELIDLYYHSYNPELARLQKLDNLSQRDILTEI